MPGAIAGIVKFAGFVVAAFQKSAVLRFFGLLALNVLASKLFGPKIPKGSTTPNQVMVRSAIEYRKVVYGQAMVSGPVYYNNLAGTNGENLYFGIALCDGRSDDLVELWLDGDIVPKADINWTAGTGASDGTGDGVISTAKFVGEASTTAAWCFYYLGYDDQPAPGELTSTFGFDWTADHRLRGVTHFILKFLYNEQTEKVWKTGPPQNIKALIKGRLIYDPRKDATNGGSGPHRYTDPTTWEWSDNPALCVADYLMTYMGVDPAMSIDWTLITDGANDCDALVAIPTAATEKRFTCNGAISLGDSHKDNLDVLLSSCAGTLSYALGVWRFRASVWETSSLSIDADDLAGDVSVRGSAPKTDRVNTVRGSFIDPARKYEANEFAHVSAAAYVTRDNGETISYDLVLPVTNTETMAQRIAYRLLEQANNQIVCELEMNARGAKVTAGDIIDLTLDDLGWTNKLFRVIEWGRTESGSFKLGLREDDAADYTDPVEGDYGAAAGDVLTEGTSAVPPPTNLAATAIDGGVRLTWTDPPSRSYDHIEIWESAQNDRATATLIATVPFSPFIDNVSSTQRLRHYWIRAVNSLGDVSVYEPDLSPPTTTVIVYPLTQDVPVVADPWIRQGSTYWTYEVDGFNSPIEYGWNYEVGAGTNGTDALRFWVQAGSVNAAVEVRSVARRGPSVYDMQWFQDLAFEVRIRHRITSKPTTNPGATLLVSVWSSDVSDANLRPIGTAEVTYDASDVEGTWRDETVVVSTSDLSGTTDRFITVGIDTLTSTPVGKDLIIDVDYLDFTIAPKEFKGSGTTGTVPKPTVSTGKFLRDDGTWADSGAGSDSNYTFEADVPSPPADPGSGLFQFDSATPTSVTQIFIDEDDADATNQDTLIGQLQEGDDLHILQDDDPTRSHVYTVEEPATDNTGWWTVPVVPRVNGTALEDAKAQRINVHRARRFYSRNSNEKNAVITPVHWGYPPGDSRRYGPDPTGAADSATALNNMLLAMADQGDACRIRAGTYKVLSSLIVQNRNNIIGEGVQNTIISAGVNMNDAIFRFAADNLDYIGVRIAHMRIYGDRANQTDTTNARGIYLTNAGGTSNNKARHSIDHVYVNSCLSDAIYMGFAMRSSRIHDVVTYLNGGYGLRLAAWSDCEVHDVDIGNNGKDGVYVNGAGNLHLHNIKCWFATENGFHFADSGIIASGLESQESWLRGFLIETSDGKARPMELAGCISDMDNRSDTELPGMLLNGQLGANIQLAVMNTGNRAWNCREGIQFADTTQDCNVDLRCEDLINRPVTGHGVGNKHIQINGRPEFFHRLIDDFNGLTIGDGWSSWIGSNANCEPLHIESAVLGKATLTTGDDAGGTMALNGSLFCTDLNWRCISYGLVFESTLKVDFPTSVVIFAGFTDQNSALEMPFTMGAGDVLTANAANAVGWLFDTAADTDVWHLVGIDSGPSPPNEVLQAHSAGPPQGGYENLRVVLNNNGAAAWFLNGKKIGSTLTNAVDSNARLTPVVAVFSRSAVIRKVDIDLIKCSEMRQDYTPKY